jgi:hypothetical protein
MPYNDPVKSLRRSLPLTLPLAASLALMLHAGCSDDSSSAADDGSTRPDAAATSDGGGTPEASADAATESCVATFRWLQKDAYKSTPGRTSTLWPPHTTTTLDVTCNGADAGSAFHENHGTLPTAADDAGTRILQEMKRETATGSRAELAQLLGAFAACQCDPTTKFLGLDALKDNGVTQLVDKLSVYLTSNLTCPAPGTADLVTNLKAGSIDAVLAALPGCTWAGDAGLAAGLDQAWQSIIAASAEVIAGYHVCNNDAKLQAGLWSTFAAGKTVAACDGDASVCHGPAWFYAP